MKTDKIKSYIRNINKKQALLLTGFLLLGLLIGFLIAPGGQPDAEGEHVHTGAEEGTIWTCSMHPQIRQPDPGQCPICGMDLIPLAEEGETASSDMVELSATAKKLALINTTPVRYEIAENEILLSGRVKINEEQVHTQTVNFRSRIEDLFVEYTGERVRRGQLIARVYSPEVVSAQEELLQAYQMRGRYPELFEAAVNKLLYWEIPRSFVDQVLDAGRVIESIPVYSKNSGAVVEQVVKEGQVVPAGGTLFQIGDLDQVWVSFDAYESDLTWIEEGDLVRFTVSTVPGEVFEGRVSYIDPFVDPRTRVTSVRVTAGNPGGLIKPEAFVRGQVFADAPADDASLVVPKSAVLWTGKRSVVYVEVPDAEQPAYRMREVTLGNALGDQYEIVEGLELGQRVVTNGAFTIDAAAQLNNKPSMMNKNMLIMAEQSPVEDYLDDEVHDLSNEATSSLSEDLVDLKNYYLPLKDAFIRQDKSEIDSRAKALQNALREVDDQGLSSTAKAYWEEKEEYMNRHISLMLDAESVEQKKTDFKYLSNILIKVYEAFGVHAGLYVQYCPMADDNKGAYWMSSQEKIVNPFRADMLGCGEVVGEVADYSDQEHAPASSGGSSQEHEH